MKISANHIENLLATTDLLDLAEQAGAQMRQNGDGWRGKCPLHNGANETAFSIFTGDDGFQHWKCFADCDDGGDSIAFIRAWKGLGFKDAIEYLSGADYKVDPEELKRLATDRAAKTADRLEKEIQTAQQVLADLQESERHLHYHENATQFTKDEWLKRGLDESWQGFYFLGGCERFAINRDYHTPTLTIPIFSPGRKLLDIRHRLLKPLTPKDKYRPERKGLGSHFFLGLPELGFDGDKILVVEGEIKAAVTYATIGGMEVQVIGVPGQGMYKELAELVRGKHVVVCPDPGAEQAAYEFAEIVGGYYFDLPIKIDDYIIETKATKDDIHGFINQARRI